MIRLHYRPPAHPLRELGAGGSNPLTPTNKDAGFRAFPAPASPPQADEIGNKPSEQGRNVAQSWHSVLALILALASPAAAQTVTGLPVVVDGDSLRFPSADVRLYGIDAPELRQTCGAPAWPCGQAAADHLRALIAGRPVACDWRDTDRFGRFVGLCRAGGRDLSAGMVEAGMALAFVRYSVAYVPHEGRAREARRGMWSGPFVAPWDYRRERNGR